MSRAVSKQLPQAKLPMDPNFDAMMIAVRVLMALGEKVPPDSGDLDSLRGFAPSEAHLPSDELACEVIQQAIKRHTAGRTAGNGAGA